MNKEKIKDIIEQTQKLHEEYNALNEDREIMLNINIDVPIKISLIWDSGLECLVEVYDNSYHEAVSTYVEEQSNKQKRKYNKDIRRFVTKCEDVAEALGVDEVEHWNAIMNNDYKKIIEMIYPELS